MNRLFLVILGVSLFLGVGYAAESTEPKTDPAMDKARTNYSVGYQVGRDQKSQGVAINPDLLLKGVGDAFFGREPLMTRLEMRDVLVDLQKQVAKNQDERVKQEADKNLADGEAFLTENSKRMGVVTLPSGLQYKVIKEGSGRRPGSQDIVTVQYRGTLTDGTEFDNSMKRGEPAVFQADHVIPAWKEALPLMKEGSKWQLFVPASLGYGQRRNGRIGPNSTLIFEIELVSIKK
jgi:FKBP-type peptidyl-prolyl cis-trans isomerase